MTVHLKHATYVGTGQGIEKVTMIEYKDAPNYVVFDDTVYVDVRMIYDGIKIGLEAYLPIVESENELKDKILRIQNG